MELDPPVPPLGWLPLGLAPLTYGRARQRPPLDALEQEFDP
jgi:hypothetical protein